MAGPQTQRLSLKLSVKKGTSKNPVEMFQKNVERHSARRSKHFCSERRSQSGLWLL